MEKKIAVLAADSIGRVHEIALLFPSFVCIILTVQTAELLFFKLYKGIDNKNHSELTIAPLLLVRQMKKAGAFSTPAFYHYIFKVDK